MSLKLGRRTFLSSLGAAGAGLLSAEKLLALAPVAAAKGIVGSMSSPGMPLVDGHAITEIKSGFCRTGSNPWEELGVMPIVNIGGTVTVMGGSTMKPEVMEAIRHGNMHFVVIDDLEVAAGKWLAKLLKAPEGYTSLVTEGDAAGLLVSYSGMMTEDYQERLVNIPDLRGFPKTEVIILNGHRDNFDHQIRQTGAKLVVVNNRDELVRAINPRTVAMHWNDIQSNRNDVSAADFISIAHQGGVYALCDASADVPPKERLWEFPAMGWDIVVFSGGKDICGPQATGFLIGKENLLHFALMNMSPQENRIGRPCKVAKESLFGLLKAVEMFVTQDYSETLRKYDSKAETITKALAKYGVTANPRSFYLDEFGKATAPAPLGNVSPRYSWTWDPEKIKLTGPEITQKLGETKPVAIGAPPGRGMGSGGLTGRTDPNWTGPNDYDLSGGGAGGGARAAGGAGGGRAGGRAGAAAAAGGPGGAAPAAAARAGGGGGRGGSPNSFGFSMWLVKDGEDRYIANRLVQIFEEAGAKPVSGAKPAAKAAAPAKKG